MAYDAHKNFAQSLVATAPSPASSGTSLVVTGGDGTKFPAVPFNATIWPINSKPTTTNAEVVRVTAISTDTLTITRTQESSSARTVIVGDQIAATITAKTLTDVENLTFNPYKFRVYRNAAQNSGNGAFALLACDSTTYDTGSNVDIVTNKGRFTAPIAGFYHFDATCGMSTTAITNEIIISLYINGAEVSRGVDTRAAGVTENIAVTVSDTLQLAATDYVEAFIFGTAAYAILTGSVSNHFSGYLVSRT